MKKIFTLLLLWLLDVSGINALCRKANRNKAIILWYHGVCDEGFNLTKRHIPKSTFRKQLIYLKRKGYVFTTMSGLLDIIESHQKLNKAAVITFDDGFKNVIENAYPIMKEFDVRGCCYVVSDLIGTDQLLWTDYVETVVRNQVKGDFQFLFIGEEINYRLENKKSYEYAMKDIKEKLRLISDKERHRHLEQFKNFKLTNVTKEFIMASWEQIKELDQTILEIGCHTKRHPNCANLTLNEELEDEIRNSKIDIERHIGHKIQNFSYPAGSYDDKVIDKLKESGYRSAVTTSEGFIGEDSDLYRLKRILTSDQFLLFKANLSGSHNLLLRIRAFLRRSGDQDAGNLSKLDKYQAPGDNPILTKS